MSIYLFILWWDQFLPRLPAPFHRCRWGSHRSPLRGPRRLVCACLENPKDVENIWGKPFGKGCFFHIDVSFQPGVMSMCIYIYIYIWYMYVCFVYVYTYVHSRIYLYTYKKRDEKTHLSQVPWMKRLQARIWNGGYMLQYTNYIRWSVSPIAIYIICYFLCNYFSYIPCSAETGGFVQCMDCSMPRLYPIDIPLYLMYTSFRYHLYTVIYRLYPI